MTWLFSLALASTTVWIGLLIGWHGFWRAEPRLPRDLPAPDGDWPGVVAIIPARDEATTIAAVVAAHSATTYPGPIAVVVVDDGSTDGTGDLARDAAAGGVTLQVVTAPPLRPGWSGKMGAVAAGIDHAESRADAAFAAAQYWLLTDADILHAPDTLARLVALAEHQDRALVSLMARLETGPPLWHGALGRLLVPAYVFFFQKLYPFAAVADPSSRVAGAAGGCMLVNRAALTEAGGISAIRDALIDDCALAALLKRRGGRLWLGLAEREVISLRDTGRAAVIWQTVVRTAYVQLQRSPWLLLGCVLGMGFLYLSAPVAALVGVLGGGGATNGSAALMISGLAGWSLQALAFAPTLSALGVSRLLAPLLPVAGFLYLLMTLDSARRDWLGRGAPWKGRTYGGEPADTPPR
ncbi:MAG: glycosyltransferase [Pseudomonadota bacterium]